MRSDLQLVTLKHRRQEEVVPRTVIRLPATAIEQHREVGAVAAANRHVELHRRSLDAQQREEMGAVEDPPRRAEDGVHVVPQHLAGLPAGEAAEGRVHRADHRLVVQREVGEGGGVKQWVEGIPPARIDRRHVSRRPTTRGSSEWRRSSRPDGSGAGSARSRAARGTSRAASPARRTPPTSVGAIASSLHWRTSDGTGSRARSARLSERKVTSRELAGDDRIGRAEAGRQLRVQVRPMLVL